MIHIDRPPLSPDLQASLRRAEEKLLAEIVHLGAQERYKLDRKPWDRVRGDLVRAFHGKCAYCESPVTATGSGDLEHFRPKSEALGLDGKSHPLHYVWLAYTWENLYLVCRVCNINKKTQFPVEDEAGRAPFRAAGAELRKEKALLIDPCLDRPEEHLRFGLDGTVTGISHKGGVTIEILGLNRTDLVQPRRRAIEEARMWLQARRDEAELIHESRPYAGAVRQAIPQLKGELATGERKLSKPAHRSKPAAKPKVGTLSLAGPATPGQHRQAAAPAAPVTQTSYVKSVRIRNFRAIRNLKLNLDLPTSELAGWTMLLGENAAGKSSVLQALALALGGKEGLARLEPDWSKLLTNGETEGSILLNLTSEPGLIALHFDRETAWFTRGSAGVPTLVLGYGATRLLPKPGTWKPREPGARSARRTKNLFDPFTPLADAGAWMNQLDSDAFNGVVKTLKDLLQLEGHTEPFRQEGDRVVLDHGGNTVTLDQLSSGYQSLVALAADIMEASPHGLHDKKNATGIVVLDEVDAHLHPRWKMEVTGLLRRAFTGLQFLASTHEPLCLRGLQAGEIVLMRRDEEAPARIEVITDLPSPEKLRVDQLLTSRFFGLNSTLDPVIEKKFRRYYYLLAQDEKDLGEDERKERDDLAAEVSGYGTLGYTRRDQLVYEAIDEFLANERRLAPNRRAQVRQETLDKVRRIWERVGARREADR